MRKTINVSGSIEKISCYLVLSCLNCGKQKFLMEKKTWGAAVFFSFQNGYCASSYIIMAFDNTEDSQHVYYLILPLHPTQVIYLSKKKENTMKAAKEHFPGSPKHKSGLPTSNGSLQHGDYLLQTTCDLHL